MVIPEAENEFQQMPSIQSGVSTKDSHEDDGLQICADDTSSTLSHNLHTCAARSDDGAEVEHHQNGRDSMHLSKNAAGLEQARQHRSTLHQRQQLNARPPSKLKHPHMTSTSAPTRLPAPESTLHQPFDSSFSNPAASALSRPVISFAGALQAGGKTEVQQSKRVFAVHSLGGEYAQQLQYQRAFSAQKARCR
jgi:hypothetical protein